MAFSAEIEKLILKVHMESQGAWTVKMTLRKNKADGLILPRFKIYYKAAVLKIKWYW